MTTKYIMIEVTQKIIKRGSGQYNCLQIRKQNTKLVRVQSELLGNNFKNNMMSRNSNSLTILNNNNKKK